MANMFDFGNLMIKFNGLSYNYWSEMIQFQLGVMDLYLTLIMDEIPSIITETNIDDDKSLHKTWEWSNRLALNLMR